MVMIPDISDAQSKIQACSDVAEVLHGVGINGVADIDCSPAQLDVILDHVIRIVGLKLDRLGSSKLYLVM